MGTPKSSILMGFSIINHPFWGIYPYLRKRPFPKNVVTLFFDKQPFLAVDVAGKSAGPQHSWALQRMPPKVLETLKKRYCGFRSDSDGFRANYYNSFWANDSICPKPELRAFGPGIPLLNHYLT